MPVAFFPGKHFPVFINTSFRAQQTRCGGLGKKKISFLRWESSTIPLLSRLTMLARPLATKAQDTNQFQHYRITLLAYIHTFHKYAGLVVCKSSLSATCNYVQFRQVQRDTNYEPGNSFRVFYVHFRIASLFTVPIFWVNSRMVKLALRAETQEHVNIMWAIHRQSWASTSESKIQTCIEGKPFNFFLTIKTTNIKQNSNNEYQ